VLLWLLGKGVMMPAVIYSDSKLIVNQFNGRYATNVPRLMVLRDDCRAIAEKLHKKVIVTLAGGGKEQPRAVMMRKLGH